VDKARNADGIRQPVKPPPDSDTLPDSGVAPLLRQLMREYAATGLPPAFIPQEVS